jgi:hypothetical protein
LREKRSTCRGASANRGLDCDRDVSTCHCQNPGRGCDDV